MPRTKIVPSNFEMFSGNTRVLKVAVLDQDEVKVDLTGATATFVLMPAPGQVATLTKTVGSGIVITDALNGLLEITLLPADTDPLRGTFAHELEVTDAVARKTTVLFGTVNIKVNTA